MKRDFILFLLMLPLALLFLYAACSKLLDIPEFIRSMHNQPFPLWASNLMIGTIPTIEIVIVILLYTDRGRTVGFWAATVLLLLFTGYVTAVLLHFFPRVPCSCGGIIEKFNWLGHLFLNIAFLFIGMTGLYISYREVIVQWIKMVLAKIQTIKNNLRSKITTA